jgi:hypothetical protein
MAVINAESAVVISIFYDNHQRPVEVDHATSA